VNLLGADTVWKVTQ